MEETIYKYSYIIDLKIQDFIDEYPFLERHREDLKQETILLLVQKLPLYDKTKSKIETYIRNQTRYACFKYLRGLNNEVTTWGDIGLENIIAPVKEELRPYIEQMGITDSLELDIIEYHLNGYTQTQIAEMVGTYQQHVSRILQNFREIGLTNHRKYGTVFVEEE